MKSQKTLANAVTFEKYRKPTRREQFLAEMERVVPWKELCALIEPFYPKPGKGRPPAGLERMLRIHFLQSWFNLSDPGAEEARVRHGIHAALCWHRPWQRGACPTETNICALPPSS